MKMINRLVLSVVLISTLSIAMISMQPVHALVTFSSPINLSNDGSLSSGPQIALSGSNNVYVIWRNDTPTIDDILFTKSTSSNLDAFDTPINLSNNITGAASDQQLVAAGNNVYVVWRNDTVTVDDIFFKRSIDNGASFGNGINLSTAGTLAQTPQIATSGNNVYVVFKDGNDIFFINSTDNGATFDPDGPFNLSSGGSTPATLPQIITSGNKLYIVWRDGNTGATDDIFFRASTDNGNTFNPPLSFPAKNLSMGSGVTFAQTPQVSASGSNVYVVWRDNRVSGNFEIFFVNSTDNGATFDPDGPFNLSNNIGISENPKIMANGNNVYVVWEEDPDGAAGANDEIFFRASTDSSSSFGSTINLSQNTGGSLLPQLAVIDDIVYVLWRDLTVSANGDISFRSSTDNGSTFNGLSNISDNTGTSQSVQAVASINGVHIVWQDNTDGDFDVLFRNGAPATISIAFDSPQYKQSDTATITVIDQSSNLLPSVIETVDVSITSTADPVGILLTLTETDVDTGIFEGVITFTNDISSGSILKAVSGDSLTATYGVQTGMASIFSRSVDFDFASYDRGSIAHVTVTDQNSNFLPGVIETVDVSITSTADPVGIVLTLTETGADTGIFGGAADTDLIFMDGPNLFPIPSFIIVSSEDTDATGNSINNEIRDIDVKSSTDPVGITLSLSEIDDTGVFSETLELTSSDSDQSLGKIKVSEGDFLTIGNGLVLSRAMVVPNTDPSNGAIEVAVPDDTVTATYLDSSDVALVENLFGGGGGGGGISRAGLVPNVVAGISTIGGGSSGGNSPPSFGASSFAILADGQEGFGGILKDNNATTIEQTKKVKVGEKAVLRFDYAEGGGIGKIEHIGLYTNIRNGQKRQDSDAYIYYDALKFPQLTIHDPNGMFSEVGFDILPKDATNFVLKYEVTFAKTMPTSDFILEGWNTQKWSSITKIPNAIEVLSSGIVQQSASEPIVDTFVEDITNDKVIPVWVKSNAKWWSDGTIDNENFISGIEYLVNEGIIKVSLDDKQDATSIPEMQPWIKSTAGWWGDDLISDDEFLNAIEWLISNKIIQVV
jgi:hypothetical protein